MDSLPKNKVKTYLNLTSDMVWQSSQNFISQSYNKESQSTI